MRVMRVTAEYEREKKLKKIKLDLSDIIEKNLTENTFDFKIWNLHHQQPKDDVAKCAGSTRIHLPHWHSLL